MTETFTIPGNGTNSLARHAFYFGWQIFQAVFSATRAR
jgi:hypothetical protein